MGTVETIFSAKQVAATLGVSSGMLRRYALTYEAITAEEIEQHPRDGRQYSLEQVEMLVRAKGLISSNRGMSVDAALRLALGADELDTVKPPATLEAKSGSSDAEAIQQALGKALVPLLTEVQALRKSNERLIDEVVALGQLREARLTEPETARPVSQVERVAETVDIKEHGPMVRFALWLERVLRR